MALVRFYKCDENAANNTVVDYSSSAINGSTSGNTNTQQLGSGPGGSINAAFVFNGSRSVYFGTGHSDASALTFSIWIRKSSFSEHDVLATNPFDANYSISVVDDETIRFYINPTTIDFTVATMAVDEWHHIFVTRNGSNGVRVWVDGVESSSGTQTCSGTFVFLSVGDRNASLPATTLNADVAYIRVFDSDESADVATYYAEGADEEESSDSTDSSDSSSPSSDSSSSSSSSSSSASNSTPPPERRTVSRFNSSLHGRPMQGPTHGRPVNAYAGQVYFDDTLACMLYYDGNTEEWRPMGVPETDGPMSQTLVEDMPGLESFDGTHATMSDGQNEYSFAEEPESSSTSSSESSSASQA